MTALPAWWSHIRGVLGLFGVAAVAVGLSVLVGQHLDHYLTRANENGRTVIAEILAQPLCTGTPPPVTTAKREIFAHL
ncbi:MAG: hypothetical protein WD034_04435 [Parvibaculum sp.]|uniref:hypothetical protein n=1 Tax=Parvibaculum sp. TaxID=2024848 RepID=UPI0034A021D1